METKKPCIKNAAIIGAGPCGLATAIGLRNQGIDAHIYEKTEEFKPAGVAIVLAHNGSYALKAILPGILDQIIRLGNIYKKLLICSFETGEVVKEIPRNEEGAYETPAIMITWHNLKQTLSEKLPKESIHLGHQFSHYEENDNGVKIWFSNGKSTYADILIGTDGLNSTVRKLICPDIDRPIEYAGQMTWQGLIPYNERLAKPDAFYSVFTPDSNIGWCSTGKDIYWIYSRESEKNKHLTKSELLDSVANWPESVKSILNAADENNIIERPLYEVIPLERWHKNRVVIAGDSAHALMPTLGQGTSLSLEDAYELTRCISSYPTIEEAFTSYEKNRKERVDYMQQYSAMVKQRVWSKLNKKQTSEQVFDEFKKLFSDDSFFQALLSFRVDKDYNSANPFAIKK